MKGNKVVLFFMMITFLSSCSAYKNKFDCPPSSGAVCRSVEEIERMVDSGEIWKLHQGGDKKRSSKRGIRRCGSNCGKAETFDDDIDDGYNF